MAMESKTIQEISTPASKVEGELEYLEDLLKITSVVGREKVWMKIKTYLERVHCSKDPQREEVGRILLIHGEAGLGKTRLVGELSQVLKRNGGTVLSGTCHEETRSIPYYPFRDAFKRYIEVQKEDGISLLETLPEYSQRELNSILPGLKGGESGGSPLQEFERAPDPYRLFEAVRLFIQTLSDQSKIPLVFIVENLHTSDEASLDLLLYLSRNLKGSRVGLFGTYRSEESMGLPDSGRSPLLGFVSSLRRERLLDEVTLDLLTLEEVSSMINLLYPDVNASLEFQKFLFEKTEGNPLFVEEVLHSINPEEINRGGSLATQWEVPQSIQAIIQGRVDLVPPETREILNCASIFGEEFEFEVLRRVLNKTDEEILEAVEVGMKSQIIRESAIGGEEGGERYRFMNALIADVLYSGIGKTRRRLWHGRAGEVLEEVYGGRLNVLNGRLVYHFERGEKWKKALDYAIQSALQAKQDYANQEAIHLYEKAKEILTRLSQSTSQTGSSIDSEESESAIAEGLGDVFKITGRYDNALKEYQLMEDSAQRQGELKKEGKALEKRGEVYLFQGNFDDAMIYAERSYETFRKTDDQKGLVESLNTIGVVHSRRGDFEDALLCFEESLGIRREIGEKKDVAESLGQIGAVHGNRGDYEKALRCFEESLVIHRESGNKIGESKNLMNIGLVHWNRGEYVNALNCFEESLMIQREIGDKRGEAESLNSIGNVKLYQGEHGEALKWYEKSLEIQRIIGNKWGIAFALQNIGVVHWYRGEFQEELKCEEEALSIRREIGDKMGIATSLNNIGDVHRILGDYENALRCFEESIQIRKEMGDKRYRAMTLRNTGEVHLIRGDYGEALKYFEESLVIQKEAGSKKGIEETLTSLGTLHQSLFDFEKAVEYHQESLRLSEEIGAKDEKARILTAIGTDYSIKGDEEKAFQSLNEALERFVELGVQEGDPEVQAALSDFWLRKGDSTKATEFCERVLKSAEKGGLKGFLARGRKLKGEILLKVAVAEGSSSQSANTIMEAESELKEALRIAEEMDAKPLLWQIHASLGKLYYVGAGLTPAPIENWKTYSKDNFTKAKKIIEEIAENIGDEELKKMFLNAKPVREILEAS